MVIHCNNNSGKVFEKPWKMRSFSSSLLQDHNDEYGLDGSNKTVQLLMMMMRTPSPMQQIAMFGDNVFVHLSVAYQSIVVSLSANFLLDKPLTNKHLF